ncbi:MAG: methyltransferase domain-containing protein [Candidatus Pacebacteria bacterium]|nr:methyltransferase domain-containing protein [Candidatus Paceibacterota bacterium]
MLNQRFWRRYFRVYDTLLQVRPYKELLDKLVESLDIRGGEKILDAGAGTGNLAILLKNAGADVTVVDFSEEALEIYKKKDTTATVIVHDLTKRLPFVDATFDKVVSNNALYNIPREKRLGVFLELKRILKPGGIIVISNIHENAKPFLIYVEAVKKTFKEEGFLKVVNTMLDLVVPTVKIFYYTIRIQHTYKNDEKNNFFDVKEQYKFLAMTGFVNINDTEFVYAKQGILDKAKKPNS